jgi:hypothetical protein
LNKELASKIENLIISKENTPYNNYTCDYDKNNNYLVVKGNNTDLFTIPLGDKTVRKIFIDVYYLIASADIAMELVDEIKVLQEENKRLKELNGIMSSEIL